MHLRPETAGAPIGGVFSAVYVLLTFAVAKQNWSFSIWVDTQFITATRYVDDGVMAIFIQ